MGLQLGEKSPDEKTLREFEGFLRRRHPAFGVRRCLLLHEHVVRLCLANEVAGRDPVWVADSTPMWCYGAVLDTIRLLGEGIRRVLITLGRARRQSLKSLAEEFGVPYVLAKSVKGAFDIDWRNPDGRLQVTSKLAEDALRVCRAVRKEIHTIRRGFRKKLLKRCRVLLRVVGDDLEAGDDGRLEIADKVSQGRLVSLTDPQATHGHKSRTRRHDGFKAHVVGDAVSGLILALSVTPANQGDGHAGLRILRRAKALCGELEQLLADTAYGSTEVRVVARDLLGVELLSPPPRANSRSKKAFTKNDFEIDFQSLTATCPNGIESSDVNWVKSSSYGQRVQRFRWPTEICAGCPLSAECPSTRGRHRILLHPRERELRAARCTWRYDDGVRRQYRRRSEGERLINTFVRHGGRSAGAWGLASAYQQAHIIGTTANLKLLAERLGKMDTPLLVAAEPP
jgi:hypothetical protein